MSSLIWKFNRLRTMGIPELSYRVGQKVQAAVEKHGLGLPTTPPMPAGQTGRSWLESLPSNFGTTTGDYIARADRILVGKFHVFAMSEADLGFPPEWNRDPKTGTVAPRSFGKALNYRDEKIVGDIKYLWEPNRHLELVALAQAWHLSQEERFIEGARILLTSWFDQNPYPLGVNWTSSLEHGIRLINWSFAWYLYGGEGSPLLTGPGSGDLKRRWLDSIYQHCFFIAGHFSKHSSANNHLLGEYAGLFLGSITWPLWPESAKWLHTARRGLEAEALVQNAPDGGNREQGIWYHHEVADMLLICALVGRSNGIEFSADYWGRLEAMLEFIASLMDVSGQLPMIGDSDDAVIVEFAIERDVYRALLATGSVLFHRGDFKAKSPGYDDKTRWLLGDEAEAQFNAIGEEAGILPVRRSFPDTGYYILGDAFETADEIRLIADAGPLGYLSIAAHGHADALAVTLSVAGHEVLVDPGTYAYHTQQIWRDYFKGTSAHNTVRIDQLDQSTSGGNFLWLRHARSECLEFHMEEPTAVWIARHDGYMRLPDPVMHSRKIEFRGNERTFQITDSLQCDKQHSVEIHWHCGEHCKVTLEDQVVLIEVADVLVEMTMADPGWEVEIIRGQENPPLGWISRAFDVKSAIPTVRWKGLIDGGRDLVTNIAIVRKPD